MSVPRTLSKLTSTSSVTDFIQEITTLFENKSELVSFIERPKTLLHGLNMLNSLIEMGQVKKATVQQIRMLLVNEIKKNRSNKKKKPYMLHTIVSGPPGVGKSKVAKVLATIWHGIGITSRMQGTSIASEETTTSTSTSSRDVNTTSSRDVADGPYLAISSNHIEVYNSCYNMESSLMDIAGNVSELYTRCNELHKKLVELQTSYCPPREEHVNKLVLQKLYDVNSNRWADSLILCNELNLLCLNSLGMANPEDIDTSSPTDDKSPDTSSSSSLESSKIILPASPITRIASAPRISVADDPDKIPIVIVGRDDIIGKYAGHTAPLCKDFLARHVGYVLVFEEAYTLINDAEKDGFGFEALVVLTRSMNEDPDKHIFIFTGYRDMLDKTVFRAQEGLRRRFQWCFEIKSYTPSGLAQILKQQLEENDYVLDKNIDIVAFFTNNISEFPAHGGDTEKLSFQCDIAYSDNIFSTACKTIIEDHKQVVIDNIITPEILEEAFQQFKLNHINPIEDEDDPSNRPTPDGWYV